MVNLYRAAAGGGSDGGLVKGVWLWFKRTSMLEPGNSLAVSGLINPILGLPMG